MEAALNTQSCFVRNIVHSILKKETTDVDGRKMNTCREIGLLIQEVSLENVATTFSLQQQLLYP